MSDRSQVLDPATGTTDLDGGGRADLSRPPSSRSERSRHASREGWILMAPAMLLLLAMTVFPAIYLLQASFFDFTLLGDSREFVGLGNYGEVFSSPALRSSILKMLFFVVLAVSIELIIGMALAVSLSKQTWFNNIASTILLLPLAVTPAVSALVFRQLLNPNFGWVDYYLRQFGIIDRPVEWLSNPVTAWIAILGLDVWQWTAFIALILMAGMQSLPKEPYEAALVDGASPMQTFRYLTLPMLRPFIGIAVVLRVIQAFKTFDSFKVLTDGGPTDSTEIINLVIHRIALQSFRIGDAAALGIVLLIMVAILAPTVLRFVGSTEGETI